MSNLNQIVIMSTQESTTQVNLFQKLDIFEAAIYFCLPPTERKKFDCLQSTGNIDDLRKFLQSINQEARRKEAIRRDTLQQEAQRQEASRIQAKKWQEEYECKAKQRQEQQHREEKQHVPQQEQQHREEKQPTEHQKQQLVDQQEQPHVQPGNNKRSRVKETSNVENTVVNQTGFNCDTPDESYRSPTKRRRRMGKDDGKSVSNTKSFQVSSKVDEFKGILAMSFKGKQKKFLVVWQNGLSTWENQTSFADPNVPKTFQLKMDHKLSAHNLSGDGKYQLCNADCQLCRNYAEKYYMVPYTCDNSLMFLQSFTMSDVIKTYLYGSDEKLDL